MCAAPQSEKRRIHHVSPCLWQQQKQKNLTQNRQQGKRGEAPGCHIFQREKQSIKAEQRKTNNPANSHYRVLAQNSYCTNGTSCRGNNEMLSAKMMLSIVVTHHTASCLASPVLPCCQTCIQLRVTASLAGEISCQKTTLLLNFLMLEVFCK